MANVIDKETAAAEFDRFIEAYEIETDELDAEETESLEGLKKIFVRAVCKGALVIEGGGKPVYTPRFTEGCDPLTFRYPKGDALLATDGKKDTDTVAKSYAMLGVITGRHPSTFAKMDARDLTVCSAIMSLFLG